MKPIQSFGVVAFKRSSPVRKVAADIHRWSLASGVEVTDRKSVV